MPSSTATGAFGPAPPGTNLTENQNGRMLGAVVPVAVFGTVAVILRLVVRLRAKDVRLAVDDYLILAALVRNKSSSDKLDCADGIMGSDFLLGDSNIMLYQ